MKQRSEYSRYYGDFRGVDFSSDHTLVHESRFPYLVNMYKDYASGGGQGIETVPGFRRRFTAPNSGRIYGIHSYKLQDENGESKRHVLVHAGDQLYDWAAYPKAVGDYKAQEVVVKEYDEHAADAYEDVRIDEDYVEVYVKAETSCEFLDIRAIKNISANQWISIYSEPVYNGEVTNVIRLPDAYTLSHTTDDVGNVTGVRIKFTKTIKDSAGNVVARFSAGDSIQVQRVEGKRNKSVNKVYGANHSYGGGLTNDAEYPYYRRRLFTFDSDYANATSRVFYIELGGEKYTAYPESALSPSAFALTEGAVELKKIPSKISGAEGVEEKSAFSYTELDGKLYFGIRGLQKSDSSVYMAVFAENGDNLSIRGNETITVRTYNCPTTIATYTAVEYDEYDDETQPDYVYFDVVSDGGFEIDSITKSNGEPLTEDQYLLYGNRFLVKKSLISVGDTVKIKFKKNETESRYSGMNEHDSQSFVFNNRIYIIDGKNYLVYDGESVSLAADEAYVPTTYINIVVGGENADAGKEYEPRNMLSPYFRHTFVADGETTEYHMNENMLEGIESVKVYGVTLVKEEDYDVDLINGKITFKEPPAKPEDARTPVDPDDEEASEGDPYPEMYAGVEITAKKGVYPMPGEDGDTTTEDFRSMINGATIATIFDNRVFFSGIPTKPNFIFWSNVKDPAYIGVLNYAQDGTGTTPITAMVRVANSLLVLKGDTEQEGAIYYHTPYDTGIDVMPKTYPSEAGLAGIGCLGAACNFLDDPVYVSRLGLEAVGYRSLQNERSKEHRSSLIDAKLTNIKTGEGSKVNALHGAKLCEWDGYLVLLVDGKIFLADSRQVYQNKRGETEYEWYYLEDIGVFEGQYARYRYLEEYPVVLLDEENDPVVLNVEYDGEQYPIKLISEIITDISTLEVDANTAKVETRVTVNGKEFSIAAAMYRQNGKYHACLCDTDGEQIGGTFCPAVVIREMDDNIFFGTTNGVVCSFNFDMRGEDGFAPTENKDFSVYTFDDRTIYSGCAIKMDNCGVPHMTKSTVKKSTVVKVKSFQSTAAKVRVRTNNDPYKEIERINATRFSFENMDFSDFSFVVGEDSLFSIREKEKKWVEKQYYVYSDEYKKPFALLYVAYKYFIAGKFKK